MPIPEKPGRQETSFVPEMGMWRAWEYVGGMLSVHAVGRTREEANSNLDKRVPEFPSMLAEHLTFLESEGIDPVTRKRKVAAQ